MALVRGIAEPASVVTAEGQRVRQESGKLLVPEPSCCVVRLASCLLRLHALHLLDDRELAVELLGGEDGGRLVHRGYQCPWERAIPQGEQRSDDPEACARPLFPMTAR